MRFFVLMTMVATSMLGQMGRQSATVPNYVAIGVAQNCLNWCWAAGAAMLTRSQGINIPQEEFVRRIYGPSTPCLPTFGRLEPIVAALQGTYSDADGQPVTLRAAFNYGPPTDAFGMIRSIQEGRPFIFAWRGHAYVGYGLTWDRYPNGGVQIWEIKLIDPMFGYGAQKYTNFLVGRDNFGDINGTLELIVDRGSVGPASGGGSRKKSKRGGGN